MENGCLSLATQDPGSEFSRALAACLDPEASCSILAKDLARPDIAPQSRNRLVTRLAHNHKLPHTVHRGLRDASGAERVSAELLDLQSRPAGCTLEELADGVLVQAAPRYMTVSSNGTEDRAFSNPGPVEPLAQRSDRASVGARPKGQSHFASCTLLVSLRLADVDDTVGGELEVTSIDEGKLRAAKSARETDQDKCGIPEGEKIFAPGGDDPADVS